MDKSNLNEVGLIQAAIQTFLAQGFTILASEYGNYSQPGTHGNYRPDIIMRDRSGLLHLVEIKTRNNLHALSIQDQLKSLSSRIMLATSTHPGEPVPLHIVVFRVDVPELLRILQLANLDQLLNKNIFIHWLDKPQI